MISVNPEYDVKIISVEDAIKNVVGTEGTILIFGNAEIVYYEGEAPKQSYMSI